MTAPGSHPRGKRVPAGRIERFARLSAIAGGLAAGTMAEGARRLLGGGTPKPSHPLLSGANGRQLAKGLATMRGAAMKLGQLLSLESEAVLPPEFGRSLSALRAGGSVMPTAQLHRVLGRELGHGWQQRFRHFSEVPIAAASIGQVHRATTAEGADVALKIQFPGVARSIDSDVDNLATLLRLTRVLPPDIELRPLISEVKAQLRRETDYRAEAAAIVQYRELLRGDARFEVPRVHPSLTTSRILAMDYVDGRPVSDLWEHPAPQRVRDRIGGALQDLVLREIFAFGFLQSDPNSGNFLVSEDDERVVLLDFGSMVQVPEPLAEGYVRLCRAALARDRAGIRRVADDFGLLGRQESRERAESLIDFILLCCEPLHVRGRYDYGASDLPDRVRRAGIELTLGRGLRRPPPPQALFIQRKLGGTFMLCQRLRARVPTRGLLLSLID
jgi:predicted unusual protein kinase regulating ubiquinone biosynthesis (AarF/ABC1/UbiB family)